MTPIFNGAMGIGLLALSMGLGVYIRQVYAATTDTYDKTFSGETKTLWPLAAPYTRKRLENLKKVQRNLTIVTTLMFAFVFLVCFRLIAYALNVTPFERFHTPDWVLFLVDLVLVVYLSVTFIVSYWAHLVGSNRERKLRDDAYKALEQAYEALQNKQAAELQTAALPSRESGTA